MEPKRKADDAAFSPGSSLYSPLGRAPADAEEINLLQASLDRFDVLERLQSGGQGTVYRVRQRGTGRDVALKVLLDGPLATDRQRFRFEREIELVSRLRHPNIVTLHESGMVRGRLYYTMEYVDGLPIDDYTILHDLSPRGVVALFTPVCRAVQFAHQSGVIHRDLKPEHIVVDHAGQARVFDFGLAKDALEPAGDAPHSCTGQVVGTLPYLSPEQAGALDGKADVRSDVYALGVILFQLLTDLFPYPVDGPPEDVRRVIVSQEALPLRRAIAMSGNYVDPRRTSEINRDLEAIVAKALAKAKVERYQSAGDLADDLERFLGGAAVTARAASAWYRFRKTVRRHRVAFGVAAAFALLALGWTMTVSLALVEARAQRDKARNAGQTALDLYSFALDEVESSVRPLPGGVEVRNRLVAQLADVMPRLEALGDSASPASELDAALLEARGDIALEQGRREEAAGHYSRLVARLESAAVAKGDAPDRAAQLATAYRKNAAAVENPAPLLESAIDVAEQALIARPDRDDVRQELCRSFADYGAYLREAARYEQALKFVERGFAAAPTAGSASFEADGWLRLRARLHTERGASLLRAGCGAEGLRDLRDALSIRERVSTLNPVDTYARHDLLNAYFQTALVERERGATESALALFHKAAAAGDRLGEMDPTSTRWLLSRFRVHCALTQLYYERNEREDAREHCDIAVGLAERAAADDPHAVDTQEALGYAALLEGQLALESDDAQGAFEHLQTAREIRLALANDHPADESFQGQLAAACYWLGRAERVLERLDEAQPLYEQCLDLYAQIPGTEIEAEAGLNYVLARVNLAALLMRRKDPHIDERAKELLTLAGEHLARLKDGKRLIGRERRVQQVETALTSNLAILSRRSLAATIVP